MCSLSKRSASSLTVMARRSVSRLAAGSSPFLVAAIIVIARLRACSQVRTELGPRLILNKPKGDNARKGAVRKRSQLKGKLQNRLGEARQDQRQVYGREELEEFLAIEATVAQVNAALDAGYAASGSRETHALPLGALKKR